MAAGGTGQMPPSDEPGWDGIVTLDETLATLPRAIARAFDRRYAGPSERCAWQMHARGYLSAAWIERTYGPIYPD